MPSPSARTLSPEEDAALKQHGLYLTRQEMAKLLGISLRTVNREIAAGQLRLYRIGHGRNLRVKTLDALNLVERVA